MIDHVFESFLETQLAEALALESESDLVALMPLPGRRGVPDRYILELGCRGLVRDPSSREVTERTGFAAGVWFHPRYLKSINASLVVTLLDPPHVFHPNLSFPFACLGRMRPGTGIVEIVYQLFEILTYRKMTIVEWDALDREACAWVRRGLRRFPVDARPLKRKSVLISGEESAT
jgi:hypothetical protein